MPNVRAIFAVIYTTTAQIYVNRKTHIKCTKITCKCKFKKGGASKNHTCALKLDLTATLVMKLRPEKHLGLSRIWTHNPLSQDILHSQIWPFVSFSNVEGVHETWVMPIFNLTLHVLCFQFVIILSERERWMYTYCNNDLVSI